MKSVCRACRGQPLEAGEVVKDAINKHTAVENCYLLKAKHITQEMDPNRLPMYVSMYVCRHVCLSVYSMCVCRHENVSRDALRSETCFNMYVCMMLASLKLAALCNAS